MSHRSAPGTFGHRLFCEKSDIRKIIGWQMNIALSADSEERHALNLIVDSEGFKLEMLHVEKNSFTRLILQETEHDHITAPR
jgi:hypothetical protein